MSDQEILEVWVIYKHPRDYPNDYVLRLQTAMRDGSTVSDPRVTLAASLNEIRDRVPPGLTRMDRFPDDDPVIVETWF